MITLSAASSRSAQQESSGAWWIEGPSLLRSATGLLFFCLVPKDLPEHHLPLELMLITYGCLVISVPLFQGARPWLSWLESLVFNQLLLTATEAPLLLNMFAFLGSLLCLAPRDAPLSPSHTRFRRSLTLLCGGIALHFSPLNALLLPYFLLILLLWLGHRKSHRLVTALDFLWTNYLRNYAQFLFLAALAFGSWNLPFTTTNLVLAHGFVWLAFLILGMTTNSRLARKCDSYLPDWFDASLRPLLLKKAQANAESWKLHNYFGKPVAHHISLRRMTWSQIEDAIDKIELREPFDCVVGITTGGALIAPAVARAAEVSDVYYVRSRYWSGLTFRENMVQVIADFAGHHPSHQVDANQQRPDLTGKKVLVVDDTVFSGQTIRAARHWCLACGAVQVKTLVLVCGRREVTDYYSERGLTPLIWPWGWESD